MPVFFSFSLAVPPVSNPVWFAQLDHALTDCRAVYGALGSRPFMCGGCCCPLTMNLFSTESAGGPERRLIGRVREDWENCFQK